VLSLMVIAVIDTSSKRTAGIIDTDKFTAASLTTVADLLPMSPCSMKILGKM
jgi:hypothetical protein